jgi:hypothetical protein
MKIFLTKKQSLSSQLSQLLLQYMYLKAICNTWQDQKAPFHLPVLKHYQEHQEPCNAKKTI